MKIKYFILIAIIAFPVKLISQTNVGGTLTGNSTWTVDKSPYNITSDIGIVPGDTLIIEPGVIISGGSKSIIVKGAIIAIGSQDNFIELNNVKIFFQSTRLNGSKFTNVTFNGAGIQLADESDDFKDNVKVTGQLDIKNCQFNNDAFVTEKGYATTTIIAIDSCTFNGATISDRMYGHNYIDLKNCEILSSVIFMEHFNYRASFEKCIFKKTDISISGTLEFSIRNSRINDSKITSINDVQTILIDSSVILNTPVSLNTDEWEWQSYNLTITNSIIKSSVSELIDYRTTTIKNSTIINDNGIVLNLVEGVNINKSLIIGGNNDNKGIIIVNTRGLTVKNTNSYISYSNFLNCKSYFFKNETDGNVTAQNNYWGTTISDTISKRIIDIYDNINYGKVDFANFLLTPDTDAPISPPVNVIKSIQENGVGLTWNSNSESDLSGYKIYYNPINEYVYESVIDVGNDTTYLIEGIDINDTIVVAAYDVLADGKSDVFEGHESWYSDPAQLHFTYELISGNSYCDGEEIQYQINIIAKFNADNHFIIQLSDTTGSFDTPTDLVSIETSVNSLLSTAFPDTLIHGKTYKIRVISTNPLAVSNSENVIFYQSPTAEFVLDKNVLCRTDTVLITYIGTGTDNANYAWNFNNGSVLSGTDAGPYEISWSNSGIKSISLRVTENGCRSAASLSLSVNQQTQPISICLVSVDSLNHNMIVWEQTIDNPYDSIVIYKESSQSEVYQRIGIQPASSISVFTDENSNPDQNPGKYKIAVIDTCGFETSQSNYHKTMHLAINPGIEGALNLSWEDYEGFNFTSYKIYRGTSMKNMVKIAQLSSNTNTYNELTPPSETVYYQIEVEKPNSCNASNSELSHSSYGSSRSNIVNFTPDNAVDNFSLEGVEIYPNPANDKLYIKINISGYIDIEILSLDGKVLINHQNIQNNREFDISTLKPGLYLLKLTNDKKSKNIKLIKR